jgi:propionyl-CoA synthetase
MRAIKQQDPEGKLTRSYDLSCLGALYLAGERCDPPTAVWAHELLRKPVVDHWWQTETGWPITAGFRQFGLFPFKPGSGGRPCPGYDLHALDDDGHVLPPGTTGNLSLRLPLPPGCGPTLWQNDDGYRASYLSDFPGWYRTGDAGMVTSGSWAAPTTSSTSPAIVCLPDRWRRCWPPTKMSPSVPSSAPAMT